MGYHLMKNFERPYFADSIQSFWKRWHISLSTWFRDYLYITLGGNRTVKWRWWYNLFITFLISGLWHGAAWTFVIWGAIHGALLVIGIWTQDFRKAFMRVTGLANWPKVRKVAEVVIVFHLVIIAWVFFRADTLPDALTVLKSFVMIRPNNVGPLLDSLQSFGWLEFVIAIGAILTMESLHFLQERGILLHQRIGAMSMPVRWGLYLVATMAIVLFGKFSSEAEFIYFQF